MDSRAISLRFPCVFLAFSLCLNGILVALYLEPTMTSEQPDYLSYLLRLWREDGEEPTNWRASLESALTGKRHVFPCLMELFAFLQRQTVAGCDANENESATEQRSPEILQ
jgi:hypothetical protein